MWSLTFFCRARGLSVAAKGEARQSPPPIVPKGQVSPQKASTRTLSTYTHTFTSSVRVARSSWLRIPGLRCQRQTQQAPPRNQAPQRKDRRTPRQKGKTPQVEALPQRSRNSAFQARLSLAVDHKCKNVSGPSRTRPTPKPESRHQWRWAVCLAHSRKEPITIPSHRTDNWESRCDLRP